MPERFKISKTESVNNYNKYSDNIDDERATEKLLPTNKADMENGKYRNFSNSQ